MTEHALDQELLQEAIADRSVEALLVQSGVKAVHLGIFDASGTLRAKRLSPEGAARALEDGWAFIDAIQWWGPDDQLWQQRGSGTQPALVEIDTQRSHPFDADALLFFAEFIAPLAELSPRHQLQRMEMWADSMGLSALVGWEFECIVLEQAIDLTPMMTPNFCWSARTLAEEGEVLGRLVDTLDAGGVPIDHVCAELGPGCLELATKAESAVRSADAAALAKLYTKAFFSQRGQEATFMAQLGTGFPGLGGHPSLSLRSSADGAPVFSDGSGDLSKSGHAAIAGVLALLPHLLAMAAPYPNSYRRFGPGNWAPGTATWGIGNYSCALRVVTDTPGTTRLELRIPGADVNPHMGLAMFLGSALWGMERGLEPPPPIVAPDDGRNDSAGLLLPRDLTEAVERLTKSDDAQALFGTAFIEHYAASRMAEVQACHRFVSNQERDRYLGYV
jgi:glutamine synthetase